MPAKDPKDIITPYAFRVEPRLLGTPLARPFRRGVAMLLDLLVLAILLLLREISGALLGIVIAWVLFRVSARNGAETVHGPVARPVLRLSAYVVLVVAVVLMFQSCFGGSGRQASLPPDHAARQVDTGQRLGEVAGLLGAVGRVAAATDSASAQPAADRFAQLLARSGVPAREREEALRELLRADQDPWRAAVARLALERSGPPNGESRVQAPDEEPTVQASDEESGVQATEGDTIAPEMLALVERLAEARPPPEPQRRRGVPGIRAIFRSVAEDLGIGIGWGGVYFTVFTVLMGGRTPGKRLVGIRVVRLNGEPVGWWGAFSRFGGYAAGLATGLIGFLQIFWDANRQGIHDKIVGTVVVREGTRAPPATP